MPTSRRFVIYGAYGFTGRLLVEEAVRRGHRPILAGRSREKLGPIAETHGLEAVAVSLSDRDELERLIARAKLVIHAAGPFVETSEPMLRACLAQRAHYLDITGELPVLRASFAHDRRAREAGVAVLSGVGFDVVPSDCLALHVARRIERPSRLRIAIAGAPTPSAGTAKSALGAMQDGGAVRRHGELVRVPLFGQALEIMFGDRIRTVVPAPLGDLETAHRSTGIPDIETYVAQPRATVAMLRTMGPLLLRAVERPAWRERVFRMIEARVHGPGEQALASERSHVWAEAINARGERAESWLEGPETYAWTARLAWDCAEAVSKRRIVGALSPAQAFGADFVMAEGVTRGDR